MYNCAFCGRPNAKIITPDDKRHYLMCIQCYQAFNTCQACVNGSVCDFETNPSPLPKQIPQEIRQGNMIIQTTVPNPERVKLTCFNCKCFNEDELLCCKQFNYCQHYKELTPSFRDDDSTVHTT